MTVDSYHAGCKHRVSPTVNCQLSLPPPPLYPRKHRELLRAIVSVKLGISYYKVNLKALDSAYSIAFPKSTPINVNKKPRKRLTATPLQLEKEGK